LPVVMQRAKIVVNSISLLVYSRAKILELVQ
jgi:hypothetical protein